MPRLGKEPILAILVTQTLLSGILAGALMLWFGRTAGISALLGGVVAVLPNAFLAARLLSPGSTASGTNLLRAAWIGEIGKLAGTVALFAAVFVAVRPLSAPALFCGYIAAQLVVFCTPLMGSGWLGREDSKANI